MEAAAKRLIDGHETSGFVIWAVIFPTKTAVFGGRRGLRAIRSSFKITYFLGKNFPPASTWIVYMPLHITSTHGSRDGERPSQWSITLEEVRAFLANQGSKRAG